MPTHPANALIPSVLTKKDPSVLTKEDLCLPDIAVLWELCVESEYDRGRLVDGLQCWLGSADGLSVLDAACGSGFPALDLIRRGYDITCADASAAMLGLFHRKAAGLGTRAAAALARWEELGDRYSEHFNVVLCRGCSLIYAGGWDNDVASNRAALAAALDSLARCLRPNGRLYLDTTPQAGLDARGDQWTHHPVRYVAGETVHLTERIRTDRDRGLRVWTSWLRVGGRTHVFNRRSLFLPHPDLVALMVGAGLREVQTVDVPGERYTVFTGSR